MVELSAQMYGTAQRLITAADTGNFARFKKMLDDTGLAVVSGDGEEVAWWNVNGKQKKDLLAALPDGAQKDQCKKLLTRYLLRTAADARHSQTFVTHEFDRSGWFHYYYSEAAAVKNTLAPDQQLMMFDITGALFYTEMGKTLAKIPYASVPDTLFQGILYELLTLGFHKIPATKKRAVAGGASDAAIISRMVWAGDQAEVSGNPSIKVVDVAAKWRGDSRNYNQIKATNGFKTKAQSQGYADMANLNKPWHPMSFEYGSKWLWYRKGQKDNCLYSVVSIGKAGDDHRPYLPYPLIKLSKGKVASVSGYVGTKKVNCIPESGGSPVALDLPVTETYLYFFIFAGLAFDTGAQQAADGTGAYPEMAVGDIPFNNVFGAIKFRRYHLGEVDTVTDDEGVVAIPVEVTRNDDDHKSIQASYGQSLFTSMGQKFDQAARLRSMTGVKWASSGAGFVSLPVASHFFTHGGARYRFGAPV